jgi:signal transduction histidine kinase
MVQRTEVAKAAEVRARQIIEEAEAEARRMRRETEDFCDQKLASFEIVLERISQTVATGRSRLAAPTIEEAELSDLDDEDRDDGPTVFDQEL